MQAILITIRIIDQKNKMMNRNVIIFQANFLAKDKRQSPRSNGSEIMTIWSESWICSTWLGGLFLIIQSWNSFTSVLSLSDSTKIRFTDPNRSGVSTRLVSIFSLLNNRCGRTNNSASSTYFKYKCYKNENDRVDGVVWSVCWYKVLTIYIIISKTDSRSEEIMVLFFLGQTHSFIHNIKEGSTFQSWRMSSAWKDWFCHCNSLYITQPRFKRMK